MRRAKVNLPGRRCVNCQVDRFDPVCDNRRPATCNLPRPAPKKTSLHWTQPGPLGWLAPQHQTPRPKLVCPVVMTSRPAPCSVQEVQAVLTRSNLLAQGSATPLTAKAAEKPRHPWPRSRRWGLPQAMPLWQATKPRPPRAKAKARGRRRSHPQSRQSATGQWESESGKTWSTQDKPGPETQSSGANGGSRTRVYPIPVHRDSVTTDILLWRELSPDTFRDPAITYNIDSNVTADTIHRHGLTAQSIQGPGGDSNKLMPRTLTNHALHSLVLTVQTSTQGTLELALELF